MVPQRPVRIVDVAREAGVSVATVSKALNGRKDVGAATRERVREVAERLRFRPNPLARSLPLGRSFSVGLLTTVFSLVISHVGATIVMVPLAINLALAAGGDPTAFALTVALSASNNFMTASNPVVSMITGPAGYSGRDLWRIGGPLSLIYAVITVVMVNLLF